MKKAFFICLALCVAFMLSACKIEDNTEIQTSPPKEQVSIGTASQNDVDSSQTLAEAFLLKTNDDELYRIFSKLYSVALPREPNTAVYQGFADTSEISSSGLFNFYLTVEGDSVEQYYDETRQCYDIPVQAVTHTLDAYFSGYTFFPEKVSFGEYNWESGSFILSGLAGFGGPSFIKIAEKRTQGENVVVLTANQFDWSENENSTDVVATETVVLEITQDGYRYQSYRIKNTVEG